MNLATTSTSIHLPQLNLPWVDSPFFERLLEQCDLDEQTKQQIQQFAQDGYLIIDPELPNFDQLAEQVIKDLQQLQKQHSEQTGTVVYSDRIQNAWTTSSGVKAIAAAPKILHWLNLLYQRQPIPFHTLNFPKGTEQPTHSDSVHFSSIPHRFMCGVWVALEDIDLENGPVHYYPGSHKLPIYNLNDLGFSCSLTGGRPYKFYPHYIELIQQLIAQQNLKKVELTIPKGKALIWAANLLHGGSPILDPSRTRYSQVTHYYFSGCMYYTPLLSDPYLGRVYLNQITNILTGEVIPQIYNHQEIQIPTEQYEIDYLKTQIQGYQQQLEQLKDKINYSETLIQNQQFQLNSIENSKFWKLRNQWFNLKHKLGFS